MGRNIKISCRTTAWLLFLSANSFPLGAAEAMLLHASEENIPFRTGESVLVKSAPMQVRVGEAMILTAIPGAEFLLEAASDRYFRLHMGGGQATLANLSTGEVLPIEPGVWLVAVNPEAEISEDTAPSLGERSDTLYRQSYHFDDYVYLRQQAYLNSIRVPAATVTNAISSFLRGLTRPRR